jgi:pimeloyl-ACP methyl ester carboxylesterase
MRVLDRFFHKITGPEDGPRLVFLHGLMGYWANWRGVISAFENRYRILAYDQRGHGRSLQPMTGYAPEDYAGDLRKILDELGWDKISLVGHSMGGRNAMVFASQFPQRINKLVIEDIGPDSNPGDVEYFENLLGRVPTPFTDKVKAKEFLYTEFNPQLGAYLYSNIEEKPDGRFDWRFSKDAILETVQVARRHNYWREYKSLTMPTLLIRGELSQELSREEYLKCLQENKNVQGVEIKGASHWVHSDKHAEFIETLKIFLG